MKKITILMSLFLVALSSCSNSRPTLSDDGRDDRYNDRRYNRDDDDRDDDDDRRRYRDDEDYYHRHWWN
jgi:hypothetical protein